MILLIGPLARLWPRVLPLLYNRRHLGVMTFLVNQTGVLYEKDLGPETTEAATLLDAFDPDESWDVVSAEARTPPDGES